MKILITPFVLICCLCTPSIVYTQGDIAKPLTKFTLESDNNYWLKDAPSQTINLVSYFKAITNVNSDHKRYPLNISVVIDRSGSMEGDKLDKTKEAVIHLIKQLKGEDVISIISYGTEVEVVVEPQKVENLNELVKKVNKLESTGSTFLSGGMEKAYELVNKVKDTLQDSSFIHRVILLSDGLANVGIIDPQALARIAAGNLENDNISLSTIGVGGDYNEKLMTALAIQGTGNYYFVENASDIPDIFKQELDGVQSLVSKQTTLKLTFPENAVKLRQVHHYNYKLEKNTVTIELNDVFSANEKAFLLEFEVLNDYLGDLNFSAQLTYQNALQDLEVVTENLTYTMKVTDDRKIYDDSFRQIGSLARLYMLSTESFQLATLAVEDDNFNEAEQLLETAMNYIKEYNSRFTSHPFLEDIYDNIKDYKKLIKELQKNPKRNRNLINRGRRHYMYRTISCPSF